LAVDATGHYPLPAHELHFVQHGENTTFRIETAGAEPAEPGPYVPNRLLLRVHGASYNTAPEIESELIWLDALRHETDLAVPEPLRASDGTFAVTLGGPETGGARSVSVLRWMRGALRERNVTPGRLAQLGRLMARLHSHGRQWRPPARFARRRWDWDGIMADGGHFGVPAEQAWAMIPAELRDDWLLVGERLRAAMAELGEGADAFGLIHADLHLGNVIFADGEARAIDFDDCGFGYWVHDLAVILGYWRLDPDWPEMRDGLLGGYATVQPFPAGQLDYLDIFMVARRVSLMLWVLGKSVNDPSFRRNLDESLAWAQRMVKAYLTGDWTPIAT
ncbi:MAG TPA: phosphotransferase, partial [Herpetosiphonaceae bacterium]